MSSRAVVCTGLLTLAGVACLASAPASANVTCQAQGSYGFSDPPIAVSFTGLAAGGVAPLSFHWDFGDGDESLEPSPQHAYAQPGVYTAILTVADSDVPSSTCDDTLMVYADVIVDPFCYESASATWGEAPLAVQFEAHEGFAGPGEAWDWRFGDGESSTLQAPAHTYVTPGTYWAVGTMHTADGSYDCYHTLRITAVGGKAGADATGDPVALRIEAPRPNPFRLAATFGFELPHAGRVRLTVLDVSGRRVATLIDEVRAAGRHAAIWQGRADGGRPAPPGLYFARLEQDGAERFARIARLW